MISVYKHRVGNWEKYLADARSHAVRGTTSMRQVADAFEDRLNYALFLTGDDRVNDMATQWSEGMNEIKITAQDFADLLRYAAFLSATLESLDRFFRTVPPDLRAILGTDPLPTVQEIREELEDKKGSERMSKIDPRWKLPYGNKIVLDTHPSFGLPLIAKPGTLRVLRRVVVSALSRLMTARGMVSMAIDKRLTYEALADLDIFLSIPCVDTHEYTSYRETGSVDLSLDNLLLGRDTFLFYYDTVTKSGDVWRSGPIGGTGSHPFFDTFDSKGRLSNWGQPRTITRRLIPIAKSFLKSGPADAINEVLAAMDRPNYYNCKDILGSIKRASIDCLALCAGPELLVAWLDYIGKFAKNQDIRTMPCATVFTTDVTVKDLTAISQFGVGSQSLIVKNRFESKKKVQTFSNFANASAVSQNPYICGSQTRVYLGSDRLSMETSENGWAVWPKSFVGTVNRLSTLLTLPVQNAPNKEALRQYLANETRALLGFGPGVVTTLFALVYLYPAEDSSTIINRLIADAESSRRLSGRGNVASLLLTYASRLSPTGISMLNEIIHKRDFLTGKAVYVPYPGKRADGGEWREPVSEVVSSPLTTKNATDRNFILDQIKPLSPVPTDKDFNIQNRRSNLMFRLKLLS